MRRSGLWWYFSNDIDSQTRQSGDKARAVFPGDIEKLSRRLGKSRYRERVVLEVTGVGVAGRGEMASVDGTCVVCVGIS
jgi:hypothetical protein